MPEETEETPEEKGKRDGVSKGRCETWCKTQKLGWSSVKANGDYDQASVKPGLNYGYYICDQYKCQGCTQCNYAP